MKIGAAIARRPLLTRIDDSAMFAAMNLLLYLAVVAAGALLIRGLGLLTSGATLAAAGMALLLLIAGGWAWLAPALTFLFLASLWTRWPGASRGSDRTRRAKQVLANGLAPMGFSLAAIIVGDAGFAAAVTGCYAAAAADTWATEWGGRFGGRPLSLRSFRRTQPGRSGAVSGVGTLATVAGAASVAVAAAWAGMLPWSAAVPLIAAGVAGSLVDSVAGAYLQGLWRTDHGEIVEVAPREHEGRVLRGLPWMDNDVVNLLATLSGGLLGWWWAG